MLIQGIQSSTISNPLITQSIFDWDPMNVDSFKATPSSPAPIDNDSISLFKDTFGRTNFEQTQTAAASQPLYKVVSGRPYLRYDGTDDVIFTPLVNGATFLANQDYTLFLVYKNNGGAGNMMRYSNGNAASSMFGFNCAGTTTGVVAAFSTVFATGTTDFRTGYKLITTTRTTATGGLKLYVNGVLEATANTTTVTAFPYSLNIFDGAFRNAPAYSSSGGDYGQFTVFNRVLTTVERTQMEQYLIAKWGL